MFTCAVFFRTDQIFPDKNTPNVLIDGVKFSEIPVCSVRVSKNNTIFSIADGQGKIIFLCSCIMTDLPALKYWTILRFLSMAIDMLNLEYLGIFKLCGW